MNPRARGDDVLRAAASRFSATVRGDEFVVVQRNVRARGDALDLAERLIGSMHHDVPGTDAAFPLRASVGVAFSEANAPR